MRIMQGVLAGTTINLIAFAFLVIVSFVILAVLLGAPRLYSKRLDRYFFAAAALAGISLAFYFGGALAATLQFGVSILSWRYVRRATRALDSF
ncbi:MAG: hypothetical protein M1319_04980 [Chloroflexi bacterium]|nr:hypothetical protein [Chloroflexota bacterium]